MPRQARLIVAGMPHHIVQRGHNKKSVFIDEADYLYYLSNLRTLKEKYDIALYAWCLMTNHVHLILNPRSDPTAIALLMKRLAGRQTRYFNKKMGCTGTLWEGRYHSSLIDKDNYLLQCCRYIDLNPVEAKMVSHPVDYRWSGYLGRVSDGEDSSALLDSDDLLGKARGFAGRYQCFVAAGSDLAEREFIDQRLNRNQLTGGAAFQASIERSLGIAVTVRKPGRPVKVAM